LLWMVNVSGIYRSAFFPKPGSQGKRQVLE
jgi:hypothetical protein